VVEKLRFLGGDGDTSSRVFAEIALLKSDLLPDKSLART